MTPPRSAHYPDWLRRAVIYQLWPASFQDSNGDGIGDLDGIRSRLDYLAWLGVDTVWISPIFVSPFRDAGYDISDFYKVDPRYGTNSDLRRLITEARKHGIRILLDLVFTHSSMDHPWFQQSQRHERNAYSDRYVWTDDWWHEYSPDIPLIWGLGERQGLCGANFFYHQPKLNFGFAQPERSWQMPVNHPACEENRQELLRIMRYWLDLGVAGFRVDSAKSYIRRDPGFTAAKQLWQWVRGSLERDYPDMVLLAEWTGWESVQVGFHAGFMLHNQPGYHAAYMAGERATSARGTFFDPRGDGDITVWTKQFTSWIRNGRGRGLFAMPTSNHDTRRISTDRSSATIKQLFAFELTIPGVPALYYGEEIGMRHRDGLPSKEGAYIRTGCRTPMQWDRSRHAGFSGATARQPLYLPIDPDPQRPTVAAQRDDPESLLRQVQQLIQLRRSEPALSGDAPFQVLHARPGPQPLVYLRGRGRHRILVGLQPADQARSVSIPDPGCDWTCLLGCGGVSTTRRNGRLNLRFPPQSWGIWKSSRI